MIPKKLNNARISLLIMAWLFALVSILLIFGVTAQLISLVALNKSQVLLEDKVFVTIYLKDSASTNQISDLQTKIEKTSNVKGVVFVSKEVALARFRLQNINNQALLSSITALTNPLPSSLEVKVNDLNRSDAVINTINNEVTSSSIVEKTSYSDSRVIASRIKEAERLSLIYTALMLTFIAWDISIFTTAQGISRRKRWAKYSATFSGIVGFVIFPIGTILGSIVLIGVFDSSSKAWFNL